MSPSAITVRKRVQRETEGDIKHDEQRVQKGLLAAVLTLRLTLR